MDTAHKMAPRHHAHMSMNHMNNDWPTGRTDTNVSPASMDFGIRQLK